MRVEVSLYGTIFRFGIFGLLYHYREYTVPGMIVIILWAVMIAAISASVIFVSDKYREWKNRPRVKTGPMPYTGIYR